MKRAEISTFYFFVICMNEAVVFKSLSEGIAEYKDKRQNGFLPFIIYHYFNFLYICFPKHHIVSIMSN